MSRRMAFLHLPPIRWLTSFYNPPKSDIGIESDISISTPDIVEPFNLGKRLIQSGVVICDNQL